MTDQKSSHHHPVRLAPLVQKEWSQEAVDAILGTLPEVMRPQEGQEINSLGVYAHHPALAAAYLPWSLYLRFGSTLSDRVRELVILRTAWLIDAEYEVRRHVKNGLRAGLAEKEIARIAVGSSAPEWSAVDRLLLQAAEDLVRDQRVGDAAWEGLSGHFSVQELMDILFVIGTYSGLAMAFNTLGVQPEEGLPEFPLND